MRKGIIAHKMLSQGTNTLIMYMHIVVKHVNVLHAGTFCVVKVVIVACTCEPHHTCMGEQMLP